MSINRGENLMRRASTCLAVLGLIALGALGFATVAPAEITAKISQFKAKAVPIPKPGGGNFPHTGNILGAGAAVEADYSIEGSGYGVTAQNPNGGIPPINEVDFFLPAGTKLNKGAFGKCTEAVLKNSGPTGCPKNSVASPKGSILGEVTFGSERVPEEAELRAFFGGPGLLFYVAGHSPVSLELVSVGHYVKASAPYSEELITYAPPVATVPGAPLASTKTIHIKAGAAIKKGKKIISYGTLPKKCPKGGFPVKTVITFGGSNPLGEFGIPPIKAEATYKAPCPKH
jgi:hypothetical protein